MYEKFEELLEKYGITAYRISKETGISQSTLSTWKAKKNILSTDKLKIIADFFGVNIDFFLNDTDDSNPNEFQAKDESERRLLMLCRKVGEASPKDKELIIKQFESTIDIYLQAKGIIKE